MSEEASERMTNRQLLTLCAKGIVEWQSLEDRVVRHAYEYKDGEENGLVEYDIVIRPLSNKFVKSDDEFRWYEPTRENYKELMGIQAWRNLFGNSL